MPTVRLPKRSGNCDAVGMLADRVEVSWDRDKHKWLVRIEVGSEVIRRHCSDSQDSAEDKLRTAAEKTVADEGYQVDPTRITVVR